MNVPDGYMQQPEVGMRSKHLLKLFAVILLIVLAIAAAVFAWKWYQGSAAKTPAEMRQQLFDEMSRQATTTVTSDAEKKKLFDQMSQPASTTAAVKKGAAAAAPAPVVSPDEKQKLLDAMQQKAP
ncbi:MAG: hypothetical protein WCS97_01135 [Candidatus Paceibacterota bacterium]|jgi:predicted negative regulator of RcsB-dependent stress response